MIKLYDLLQEIKPQELILCNKNKIDFDFGSLVKSFTYNEVSKRLTVVLN